MQACEPIYCWEGAFSFHYLQLTESVIQQDSILLWRLQYFKPDGSSLKKHVLYQRQFSWTGTPAEYAHRQAYMQFISWAFKSDSRNTVEKKRKEFKEGARHSWGKSRKKENKKKQSLTPELVDHRCDLCGNEKGKESSRRGIETEEKMVKRDKGRDKYWRKGKDVSITDAAVLLWCPEKRTWSVSHMLERLDVTSICSRSNTTIQEQHTHKSNTKRRKSRKRKKIKLKIV